MKTNPNRQRGFTLIEACMVLAVSTVLATTAAPSLQEMIAARRLENAATQLATDIQLIRTAAVARNQALRLSFMPRAGGSCYVIHTGNAGQCDCSGNGPAVCQGPAREIKTVLVADADQVSVASNASSIVFDPMHGTSTPTGTLRVVGASGREVRHVINVMGRVRSCSPAPAVPGYRAC
ncbi:MAG: GspH/FimT family pseudopilin [Burkholderiales bacterium]